MNTPYHLILNLACLGKKNAKSYLLPVSIGALLPDLPMFVFYFVESIILHTPNREIWETAYFEAHWQNFIDCFNSIPIILLALLFAWKLNNKFLLLICASMLLHIACDLPLHHDDGHRHFFPLLQWRFESPISYWDINHHGEIVSIIETLLVCLGCYNLFLRHKEAWFKVFLAFMFLLQFSEFAIATLFYF